MNRQWRRIYEHFGFRPFGVLLTVLLVFFVVVDQLAADFAEQDDKRAKLEREVSNMRKKIGQQKQIEAALQANQAGYDAVAGRGVASATSAGAATELATGIDRWLAGLGATAQVSSPQAPSNRAQVTYLPVVTTATLLPQQLVRLLRELPTAPVAMRLLELEIKVSDSEAPSALEARTRWEGVYLPPRNPLPGSDKNNGASSKGGVRSALGRG
jgi:hypothetical protein